MPQKKKSFIKQSIAQFGQFRGEVPEMLLKFHTRQKLMRSFSLFQRTNVPLSKNGKHAACNHRVMAG